MNYGEEISQISIHPDEMQEDSEAMTSTTGDDKASPEAGILRTFEKATSIHQFCPNHAWASLPGKEKILPLLFSFEDPKIEQLFFGIGEYLFL